MSGILIISKDRDFSAVMAEHIRQELATEVTTADTVEKAKALMENAQLVLTTETLPKKVPVPVTLINPPIRMNDVLAKLRARLEQKLPDNGAPIGSDHQFFVQQKMMTHTASKKTVDLTDKETQLLSTLLSTSKTIAKDILLKEVWGVVSELESHTLETHVYRLRTKLKELGLENAIVAVPGGYVLKVK